MSPWITFEVEENTSTAEHEPALIEALVKLYHEKLPPTFQYYHEGRQDGIRYTLMVLNVKIDGINK